MAETKIPAIYRVPSNTEPELKRYLESVQEALEVRLGRRGDELDQAVTYRDLIDSNLAQRASRLNRVVEPMIEEPTPSMPFNTIPQNVQASGAFTKILVTWNDHQMGSLFARAEIWRASINDLNAASATTAENISAVMTALSETLADMPGYNLLATSTTSATVIKAASSPSTRANGDALQPNDLWFDTDDGQLYTRNTANNAWVAARDSSLVTTVNSLSSTVTTNTNNIATANTNIATLTSANTARVSEITELEAITNGYSNSSTIAAAISSESTARANGDSANATSITNLTSTVSGHTSSISTLNTTTASHTGDLDAMFVLTVATESNGSKSAAGMVIGSNASNGSGAQSYVQFQADKFAIWNGNNANTAPFIVSSNTVFIANAMIQDAAITNAKIADATIETAKIVTLNADKIRSGTIEGSTVLKIGSGGSGATDQRIEITAASNRILVVDDSS